LLRVLKREQARELELWKIGKTSLKTIFFPCFVL